MVDVSLIMDSLAAEWKQWLLPYTNFWLIWKVAMLICLIGYFVYKQNDSYKVRATFFTTSLATHWSFLLNISWNKLITSTNIIATHKIRIQTNACTWITNCHLNNCSLHWAVVSHAVASWKQSDDQPRQHIKKQRYYFANKGPSSQSYGFSSSHVWMWELDYKESWAPKNWCFCTVVLEKILESLLDCKEIQQVSHQGDQSWMFIGRTDAEAETSILWPSDM